MNLKEKLNLLEDELTRIESPILRLLRDGNDGFDRDQTAHVLTNLGMCPLQMVLDFYDWATGADENILFNINESGKTFHNRESRKSFNYVRVCTC